MASRFLAASGIEEGPVHVLPESLNVLRIAADQSPGGLGQHLLRSAFADSGDAGIGLDRHHHIALIEQRVRVRRKIRSHARDLHLWKGGKGG